MSALSQKLNFQGGDKISSRFKFNDNNGKKVNKRTFPTLHINQFLPVTVPVRESARKVATNRHRVYACSLK